MNFIFIVANNRYIYKKKLYQRSWECTPERGTQIFAISELELLNLDCKFPRDGIIIRNLCCVLLHSWRIRYNRVILRFSLITIVAITKWLIRYGRVTIMWFKLLMVWTSFGICSNKNFSVFLREKEGNFWNFLLWLNFILDLLLQLLLIKLYF